MLSCSPPCIVIVKYVDEFVFVFGCGVHFDWFIGVCDSKSWALLM